jgi:hypothetical protein
MTLTSQELEAALAHLDGDALAHLSAALGERSRLRRVKMTVSEAQRAIEAAPVSSYWETSVHRNVGRLVVATRLAVENGWHPSQIAEAMCAVGLRLAPHPLVAVEAVAEGIRLGRAVHR